MLDVKVGNLVECEDGAARFVHHIDDNGVIYSLYKDTLESKDTVCATKEYAVRIIEE